MASESGIAVRVGGMRRWYALMLCGSGRAQLLQCVDDDMLIDAVDLPWNYGEWHDLQLSVRGQTLRAAIDDRELFVIDDVSLSGGGVALINSEGRTFFRDVEVEAL